MYFFSQALTAQEGREEAEYVLELLDGRDLQLPIYFDWEDVSAEDARTYGYNYENLTDSAAAFCNTLRDAGYEAGVYLNRQQGYYHYDIARLSPYSLWVADLNRYPDFYYAHDIWQYTFTAEVEGIPGVVDMNLRFIDKYPSAQRVQRGIYLCGGVRVPVKQSGTNTLGVHPALQVLWGVPCDVVGVDAHIDPPSNETPLVLTGRCGHRPLQNINQPLQSKICFLTNAWDFS